MISVVTTSMTFDYFVNAVWKSYGSKHIFDSNGKPIDDQTLTTVLVVASIGNSFVRVFVGKLLATVSYKKFYLVL